MNHARSLLDRTGAIAVGRFRSMNKQKAARPKKRRPLQSKPHIGNTFCRGLSVPCSSGGEAIFRLKLSHYRFFGGFHTSLEMFSV